MTYSESNKIFRAQLAAKYGHDTPPKAIAGPLVSHEDYANAWEFCVRNRWNRYRCRGEAHLVDRYHLQQQAKYWNHSLDLARSFMDGEGDAYENAVLKEAEKLCMLFGWIPPTFHGELVCDECGPVKCVTGDSSCPWCRVGADFGSTLPNGPERARERHRGTQGL